MIRGIGPAYAKKLVRAFGEKVFDTIEAEPDRLRQMPPIGPRPTTGKLWPALMARTRLGATSHVEGAGVSESEGGHDRAGHAVTWGLTPSTPVRCLPIEDEAR
jgi:hypothetical protein